MGRGYVANSDLQQYSDCGLHILLRNFVSILIVPCRFLVTVTHDCLLLL